MSWIDVLPKLAMNVEGRASYIYEWLQACSLFEAIKNKKEIVQIDGNGSLKDGFQSTDVIEAVKGLGFRIISCISPAPETRDYIQLMTEEGSYLSILFGINDNFNYNLLSQEQEITDKFRKQVIEKYWEPVKSRGRVYALLKGGPSGTSLRTIGFAACDFEKDNYSSQVGHEYRHIVEDLGKEKPCGRIILLDGPPGTGKTYLVRSLLQDCPNATFVMIPSGMVSSLAGPDLLAALIDGRPIAIGIGGAVAVAERGPTVLVIEDADNCIMNRDVSSMNALSSLLNLSDGILGTLIDIRIICTTNQSLDNIDSAIMRPGRLCRRIEVGLLDQAAAKARLKQLTGKEGDELTKKFYSLAEIYGLANGNEAAQPKEKKVVGFMPQKVSDPLIERLSEITGKLKGMIDNGTFQKGR